MSVSTGPAELGVMRALAERYPNVDAALAEIAALRAALLLPKGTVHVISDVHGEIKKLRHIINNASGSLRALIESHFAGRLAEAEMRELLAVLYYPNELVQRLAPHLARRCERSAWVSRTLRRQLEIVHALAPRYRRETLLALIPAAFRPLFEELLAERLAGRGGEYVDAMIEVFAAHERDLAAVRAASHLVRNLSVAEIIVAGDLGDRGPRLDRVIDYLRAQPCVSFTWGNHDASWMGACLGQEALIATVLRLSLRYRRLAQLEEGYGITLAPLEKLARAAYRDDPAERFQVKGTGLRDDLLMARMQKAAAVLQFKLDGQTSRRHPEWGLEHRNLLHRLDLRAGTVEIDGHAHRLRDTFLPTVAPEDPYALSAEERACMDRLRQSFVSSPRLWEHMSFVVRNGSMWTVRDGTVIFHGCVPVDERGDLLALPVDGRLRSGRALFDALDSVVRRAFRKQASAAGEDADWLWYLWTGPRSPLFGKDRMTTFEAYFVADETTHRETKNPYFSLIHDAEFCRRIGAELGVGAGALIVNGHVPVHVEKGEQPLKRGGNAVTIDGAFSEAYGDRGYTLILDSTGVALAEHHHFESIEAAIASGADIVPKITRIEQYATERRIADTEAGDALRQRIALLEQLIAAYENGILRESLPA